MTPAQQLRAKIQQVFPTADPIDIQRQLDEYTGQDRLRVQLAIVKLTDEDKRDSPRHYIDAARKDYRNVVAWAEYPQQMRPDWFTLSVTERAKVTKADRQQYARWLAR